MHASLEYLISIQRIILNQHVLEQKLKHDFPLPGNSQCYCSRRRLWSWYVATPVYTEYFSALEHSKRWTIRCLTKKTISTCTIGPSNPFTWGTERIGTKDDIYRNPTQITYTLRSQSSHTSCKRFYRTPLSPFESSTVPDVNGALKHILTIRVFIISCTLQLLFNSGCRIWKKFFMATYTLLVTINFVSWVQFIGVT